MGCGPSAKALAVIVPQVELESLLLAKVTNSSLPVAPTMLTVAPLIVAPEAELVMLTVEVSVESEASPPIVLPTTKEKPGAGLRMNPGPFEFVASGVKRISFAGIELVKVASKAKVLSPMVQVVPRMLSTVDVAQAEILPARAIFPEASIKRKSPIAVPATNFLVFKVLLLRYTLG